MRMSWDGRACLGFAFALAALGCASQKPLTSTSSGGPSAPTGRSDADPTSGEDLAAAFDAPSSATGRSSQAGPGVAARGEDPSAEIKIRFANRLAEAKRNLGARRIADAQAILPELDAMADALGPSCQQQLLELRYRFALAAKDFKLATTTAERWLVSCGPEMADLCRKRAISAMDRAARQLPRKSPAQERLARLQESETCVGTAEAHVKSGEKFPECAEAALAVYRQLGDKLMISRLLLAKGRCIEAEPRQLPQAAQLFTQAEKSCQEPRCLDVRRRALKSVWALHMRLGEAELAARAALSEMGLASQKLSPERRAYARTAEVDRACEALDRREGVGTCRRLEKSVLGSYTFHDFSEQPSSRQSLSVEDVRQVNQHFQVLIQDCLAEEAERLEPPALVSYHLRWIALNDGRVDQVSFDRRDQEQGPLAACLRKQFSLWRYPRYRGEYQHIDQEFSINLRERRVASGSQR